MVDGVLQTLSSAIGSVLFFDITFGLIDGVKIPFWWHGLLLLLFTLLSICVLSIFAFLDTRLA